MVSALPLPPAVMPHTFVPGSMEGEEVSAPGEPGGGGMSDTVLIEPIMSGDEPGMVDVAG